MPAPFPHHYRIALASDAARSAQLQHPPRAPIVGGAPPQFGGHPDWWSPEELLLGAAALCLMTTFQAFAARESLEILGWTSTAEGTLDKTREGLAFTRIRVRVELKVPPLDVARAMTLLSMAKRNCIVSNALKPTVELESDVSAGLPAGDTANAG